MEGNRFAIAPMTMGLRILTYVMFALPAFFIYLGVVSPPPTRTIATGMLVFMSLVFASVWFYSRPSWFEIGERSLTIVWPLRARQIDLVGLKSVEIVDNREFRRRYGFGMRVGAGGLWGGFGLLVCDGETFAMYISRTDRYVILRPRTGRALMITPEDPETFVEAIRHAAR